MLNYARTALRFVEDRTEEDLRRDEMLALACARLLEIVGEAASRVSIEFRDAHPEIRWIGIVGLRNRLVHAYFDVDLGVLWDIIRLDLPPLISELEKILGADAE
jgi:uncharacterized protein with HEPN domain